MSDERSTKIKIGDKEYELLLTTRATKEIARKYGGMSDLGDKLMKSENYDEAIDEIVWLIVTLANQTILIDNYRNKTDKPLLTTDEVELLTTLEDIAGFKEAITAALLKGTKRNVESEESKNQLNG